MATYTYSLSSDFGGNLKSRQLHDEIVAEGSISPILSGILTNDDVVDIVFNSSLSAGEQTTLNGLVSAHSPVNYANYTAILKFGVRKTAINSGNYYRQGTLIYEGTNSVGTIKKILAIGKRHSGATGISIKISDKTNGNIIAENTFTETKESILELTPINNLPTDRAILELYTKRIGGSNSKKGYLDSVTVYI